MTFIVPIYNVSSFEVGCLIHSQVNCPSVWIDCAVLQLWESKCDADLWCCFSPIKASQLFLESWSPNLGGLSIRNVQNFFALQNISQKKKISISYLWKDRKKFLFPSILIVLYLFKCVLTQVYHLNCTVIYHIFPRCYDMDCRSKVALIMVTNTSCFWSE